MTILKQHSAGFSKAKLYVALHLPEYYLSIAVQKDDGYIHCQATHEGQAGEDWPVPYKKFKIRGV